MNCMKCGREIEENQTFCPKCLELMQAYPVKTDIVIKLPTRQDDAAKKSQPRKKLRTPEEQIQLLKKRNRWLIAIASLLLVISVMLTVLSVDVLRQLDVQRLLGRNYTTVETTQ